MILDSLKRTLRAILWSRTATQRRPAASKGAPYMVQVHNVLTLMHKRSCHGPREPTADHVVLELVRRAQGSPERAPQALN